MTVKQSDLLKKELKNWQEIYEAKKNVISVLVAMGLTHKLGTAIKNAIVDNLVIERDAQYRIKIIKTRLGVR